MRLRCKLLLNHLPRLDVDDGCVQTNVLLFLMPKPSNVDRVGEDRVEVTTREPPAAARPSGAGDASRRGDPLGVEGGFEPDHAAKFEVAAKQHPDKCSFRLD